MSAMVGVKGLEEADASAVLGEGVTNPGQWDLTRGESGRADVMPGALSQSAELLGIHSPGRAHGVESALLCQVGDLLQGDHWDYTGTYGL